MVGLTIARARDATSLMEFARARTATASSAHTALD